MKVGVYLKKSENIASMPLYGHKKRTYFLESIRIYDVLYEAISSYFNTFQLPIIINEKNYKYTAGDGEINARPRRYDAVVRLSIRSRNKIGIMS